MAAYHSRWCVAFRDKPNTPWKMHRIVFMSRFKAEKAASDLTASGAHKTIVHWLDVSRGKEGYR
jgi:hypothetical protein